MSRIIKFTIIIALPFALTAIFTYPLIRNLNTHIACFYSTDEPYGVIWSFWWFKYAFLHRLSAGLTHAIAYPFGVTINIIPFFPFWGLLAKYIAIFSNEIFAFNILLLSTFILSFITMYRLAIFITKDFGISIFCALIFAFCPFHFVRYWQHFGTAQIQWIPLYILFLLKLWKNKNIKFAFLLGSVFALNYYFEVHYAYFVGIAAFLFLLLVLFSKSPIISKWVFLKLISLSFLIGFIIISPALLPFLRQLAVLAKQPASAYSLVRPFEDLFAQSARPLSYLLPFTEQPVFGNLTKIFIGSDIWGRSLTEQNIFLGITPLFLSIVAFMKRKEIIALVNRKGPDIALCLKFTFLLILISWLFSQPPWWNILGFKLYMPSFFMYKILPMFRAYVRFGIIVMLGISILAGLGLMYLLGNLKSKKIKAAILSLACILVLSEFWSNPKQHIIDLSSYPEVYNWLKDQKGDFVIAEYPLDADSANEIYKFFQVKHEKKIINGTVPGTPANRLAQTLVKLSLSSTTDKLREWGVRYVLVHHAGYLQTGLVADKEELDKVSKNKSLRLIKNFAPKECPQSGIICVQEAWPIDVYEVLAGASKP